jgi:hypothetical protein
LNHLESNSQLPHRFRIVFYMSHSYSTPPPSASRHLHFVMCTEHHRIYGYVLSKPLTLQTFQNTFSDSPWLTLITNLNLVLANTASPSPHTCQTTCMTACVLVCCRVPCFRTPRRYYRIEHPQAWPRSPETCTHTISGPTADNHQSFSTDAEFHASSGPLSSSPDPYTVAPPSAEWNLPSDSSSTFNTTPW